MLIINQIFRRCDGGRETVKHKRAKLTCPPLTHRYLRRQACGVSAIAAGRSGSSGPLGPPNVSSNGTVFCENADLLFAAPSLKPKNQPLLLQCFSTWVKEVRHGLSNWTDDKALRYVFRDIDGNSPNSHSTLSMMCHGLAH